VTSGPVLLCHPLSISAMIVEFSAVLRNDRVEIMTVHRQSPGGQGDDRTEDRASRALSIYDTSKAISVHFRETLDGRSGGIVHSGEPL
jgi:RecA-family ATPase